MPLHVVPKAITPSPADIEETFEDSLVFYIQLKMMKGIEHLEDVPLETLREIGAESDVESIRHPNRVALQYMKKHGILNVDIGVGKESYQLALNFLRGKTPSLDTVDELLKKNHQWIDKNIGLISHVWENSTHDNMGYGMPSWIMQGGWAVGVLSYIRQSIHKTGASPIHPGIAKIHAHILYKLTDGKEGAASPPIPSGESPVTHP